MKQGKILKTIRSIKGNLVSLEPFSLDRYKEFYQLYLSSKSEWEKFLVLHFKDIDGAKNFVAQQYNNDHFTGYFVILNETNEMIGFIFGDEIDDASIVRTRATATAYEHKGYGYEATQLFEALMRNAGYASITLACDATNLRSKELLLRDGYHYLKGEHVEFGFIAMDFLFYSKQL